MNLVRIKDNTPIDKGILDNVPNITREITDKTLEQLEADGIFVFPEGLKETDDLTGDQYILRIEKGNYHTGNVMGFLGYEDERLIIGSRFEKSNNDYLFRYLLDKVFDIPNIVDLSTDADEREQVFTLFLFVFPYYLQRAMRKGLFKKYNRYEYNDENVRGTIDIRRHISKNIPFVGNIAYSQRELSYDNHLTELIRHTIEYIKKKTYGNKLLYKVKDEVKLITSATPKYNYYDRQKIITDNKKTVIRHAYYREYFALQQLCLLILQNRKHIVGSGGRRISGILFDGAWLWEEYINRLIGDNFYHPQNKAKKGGQSLFSGNYGRVFPDFISKDYETRIIADAKYKNADNIGKDSKDYLQVLAYMLRFDSKKALLIYPESEEMPNRTLWLNSGSTYENNVTARTDTCVIKYGLRIASNKNTYEDFVADLQVQESELKEYLDVGRTRDYLIG